MTRPVEFESIEPVEAVRRLRSLEFPFLVTRGHAGEGFSWAGAAPYAVLTTTADGRTLVDGEATGFADPFEGASRLLAEGRSRAEGASNGPDDRFPFTGGCVGYFSYDLKDLVTPTRSRREAKTAGDDTPLAFLPFYDVVYVYDHASGRGYLASTGGPGSEARVEVIRETLRRPSGAGFAGTVAAAGPVESNFTRTAYMDAVAKAQEYIAAGDIYQINLSQRLAVPVSGDPLDVYSRLLETNPVPFATFLDCGPFQVICNTPERLLAARNGLVETSPIKGTRPRGADPEADRAMVEELGTSVKERAEHVMIVDLERNDLGRVCEPGSVEVAEFEKIETYAGLHHMVSTVRGRPRQGFTPMDCLRAAFPGGSITGAPKIRAMEIIDELEGLARGIYTGGVGWAGFDGRMDISMAIRTAVWRGSTLSLHVGGGIVADSVPEDEYDETMLKAASFLEALGLAGTLSL